MENIIEHEGKKYRVVEDDPFNTCHNCCFKDVGYMCGHHAEHGFPLCTLHEVHFELVEETNQKE